MTPENEGAEPRCYTAFGFLDEARRRLPEVAESLRDLEREPRSVLADLVAYEVVAAMRGPAGELDPDFGRRARGFLDGVTAYPEAEPDVHLAIGTALRHISARPD